ENFGWRRRPPVPALEVVSQLEAMHPSSVIAVRDEARRELSAETMLHRHLALIDDLSVTARNSDDELEMCRRLLESRFGGARRLSPPIDKFDRGLVVIRGRRASGW